MVSEVGVGVPVVNIAAYGQRAIGVTAQHKHLATALTHSEQGLEGHCVLGNGSCGKKCGHHILPICIAVIRFRFMANDNTGHLCGVTVKEAAEGGEGVIEGEVSASNAVVDAQYLAVNSRTEVEGTYTLVSHLSDGEILSTGKGVGGSAVASTGIMGSGYGQLANIYFVVYTAHPRAVVIGAGLQGTQQDDEQG